ncbi:Uncharacterized protein At4g02000 [Linum grandiflorum]
MAQLWRPGQGMQVLDLGEKQYLFQFNHIHDLRWVVESGPWTFDNALLVLHELKRGETPETVLLTSAPFWVQIHGLPSRFSTEKVGKIVGAFVGEVVTVDAKHKYTRETPYLRVRIILDVTKPLLIDKKVRQPRGEWLTGKFRYEKLPTFCFLCGRIGHVERHCAIFYRTANPETLVRKWDASLRADFKKPVVLGGAQWLVQSADNDNRAASATTRIMAGHIVNASQMHGRPVPRSMTALRHNLGVSLWRPMGEEIVNDEAEEMEGVELPEERKRRRAEGATEIGVVRDSSGTHVVLEECHGSKSMVLAGPEFGTCPPQ